MTLTDAGIELLDDEDCWQLLELGVIGRIGVSVGALPAIFPVNYALSDGAIVFCTAPGTKLRAAIGHAVVAFQVDDYDATTGCGWSVLAVGTAEVVDDPAIRARALAHFADGWSTDRSHVVRIHPTFMSGRRVALPASRH